MTKVAIINYSATGTTHKVAKAVEEEAAGTRAEVRVLKARELAPDRERPMSTPSTTPPSSTRRRTPIRFAIAAAVAVIATVAPNGTAQASAPPRAPAPTSTPAAVSTAKETPDRSVPQVVRQWEAAWNSGDGQAMASLFTDDGVYQDFALGYRFAGREQIAGFVEESLIAVPNLHVQVGDAFRTGDRVGVRFTFTGQFDDAPTPFSVPVFTVMELKGNKISYDGDYYNRLEVLRQSGLPTN